MAVYCGIDWAEGHHDIALVDGDGRLVAKRRIKDSPEGVAELTAMLAAAGDGSCPGSHSCAPAAEDTIMPLWQPERPQHYLILGDQPTPAIPGGPACC